MLTMLHPASLSTVAETADHPACPLWLAAALRAITACFDGGRAPKAQVAKQRLALAAAVALEVTALMESSTEVAITRLLGFAPRRIL
ncbi:MAG: hypothetical protein P4L83_08375, partial [Nevskia sp.]|nr:hypothetical protein [Nevskia sp.]